MILLPMWVESMEDENIPEYEFSAMRSPSGVFEFIGGIISAN
jgi:hypothetical protein